MACFLINAACTPGDHAGNGWHPGGGASLCTFHYNETVTLLRGPGLLPFADDLMNDYIKIYLLMRNNARMMTELTKLNVAMGSPALAALQDPDRMNYVKLSDALTYFERKCWFPETHLILVGLLPGADFLRLLKSGYMPKDVGAGANHGEFSHRLQWHAIMRLATNDFATHMAAGWNHTPYDLYCSFGEGNTLAGNLWGIMLDNQGVPGDCRNPSVLDTMLRNSPLAALATKLNNVRAKRMPATNAAQNFAMNQADREAARTAAGGRVQQKAFVKLGDNFASQVTAAAYVSHKGHRVRDLRIESKVADVRAENPDLVPGAFDPARALPATSAVTVLRELGIYSEPDRRRARAFNVCMAGGAMIRTGEELMTPAQVNLRRLRSRAGLKV